MPLLRTNVELLQLYNMYTDEGNKFLFTKRKVIRIKTHQKHMSTWTFFIWSCLVPEKVFTRNDNFI